MEPLQFDANGEVVSPYSQERIDVLTRDIETIERVILTLEKWLDAYDENELEG